MEQQFSSLNNNTESHNDSRHFIRMIIVTLVVLVLGTGVYIGIRQKFFAAQNPFTNRTNGTANSSSSTQQAGTPSVFDSNKAWLSFTQEPQNAIVGQPVSFDVSAFSENKDIQGFDILLAYDKNQFEIVSVESLVPSFQIFQFQKEQHMTITGIKQLAVTEPTVFNNTKILRLTIKPKGKGQIQLSFLGNNNKEQTKFVDDKVTVIRPQLQPLTVAIN